MKKIGILLFALISCCNPYVLGGVLTGGLGDLEISIPSNFSKIYTLGGEQYITGTTTKTNYWSQTIPARSIGKNGYLEIKGIIEKDNNETSVVHDCEIVGVGGTRDFFGQSVTQYGYSPYVYFFNLNEYGTQAVKMAWGAIAGQFTSSGTIIHSDINTAQDMTFNFYVTPETGTETVNILAMTIEVYYKE